MEGPKRTAIFGGAVAAALGALSGIGGGAVIRQSASPNRVVTSTKKTARFFAPTKFMRQRNKGDGEGALRARKREQEKELALLKLYENTPDVDTITRQRRRHWERKGHKWAKRGHVI